METETLGSQYFHDFPLKCFVLEVICCLFRKVLLTLSSIIKIESKIAFSTKLRTMKLKSVACSVSLMFISISQQLLSFSALYIGLCSKKSVKHLTGQNLENQKQRSIHSVFRGASVEVFFERCIINIFHWMLCNDHALNNMLFVKQQQPFTGILENSYS